MKISLLTALFGIMYALSVHCSCAGGLPAVSGNTSYVKGALADGGDMLVFDGIKMHAFTLPPGGFEIPHTVTEGLYGVVFITKDGFRPETVPFAADGAPVEAGEISLRRMGDTGMGIITGVVYKPVRGGKLRRHNGIGRLFKGERITINGAVTYSAVSDERGVFMMELPVGEYGLVFGNKTAGNVTISQGKTAIRNIRKGTVLAD